MDTEENLRKKRPCYPTGGQVVPHITSQGQCGGYGFFWIRGKCWACY